MPRAGQIARMREYSRLAPSCYWIFLAIMNRLFRLAFSSVTVIGLLGGVSICVAGDEPFTMPLAPFHSEGKRISADQRQLEEVMRRVSSALDEKNVDALNNLADALLKQRTPTPAGYLPLRHFHFAIKRYLTLRQPKGEKVTTHTFGRALYTMRAWQKRYPMSGTAIVAEADVLLRRALAARFVGDTVDEVPPEQLEVFKQSIAAAHRVLTTHQRIARTDPFWYEKMASVMWYGKANRNDFIALIDEGMRAYPNNLGMADSGITYMLPRWGGSDEEVVAYIHHVLSNVSAEDAPIVAAGLYYHLLNASYYNGIELAYLLQMSTEQIEQTMAAQVARYPDPVNVDEEAVVTCSLGDKAKLRQLLAKIGNSPIVAYWGELGDGSYFSFCRRYLTEGAEH
jgi:hypothetical protein